MTVVRAADEFHWMVDRYEHKTFKDGDFEIAVFKNRYHKSYEYYESYVAVNKAGERKEFLHARKAWNHARTK